MAYLLHEIVDIFPNNFIDVNTHLNFKFFENVIYKVIFKFLTQERSQEPDFADLVA